LRGYWVWEEESEGEGCMRKRKEIRCIVFGRRAEEAIWRIAFVKLHIANHWDSTGTWRKMSI
jgi:hypothetical protein